VIRVDEAVERLLAAVTPLPPEARRLDQSMGRTLAEDVRADRDAPPADRSAMDGFAVRAVDVGPAGTTLRLAGEVRAGASVGGVHVAPGTCVRIFTGAVIPDGADAVVMIERVVEDPASGAVRLDASVTPGQHVRRRGEDRRKGEVVVSKGTILRPAEVAALASVGCAEVSVVRPPRVAVLSTGDELVAIDRLHAAHQVRNSNAAMLLSLLEGERLHGEDLGIAGDEPRHFDAALAAGLLYDVLLVSGGVSVGAYDLVGEALARRGAAVLFHTVAMRPGKPILAARCGEAVVLGLPGNPVSAFTAFHVFAAPVLRRLSGDPQPRQAPIPVRLEGRLQRRPERRIYALGRIDPARRTVVPVESASSGDVFALARANAFIVVEGGDQPVEAGETVEALPWDCRSVVPAM
jgi:molybdopterin molybdotransferase